MQYSIHIEAIYQELPFADRFAAAKRDGFHFVELWDWDNKNIDELITLCKKHDIEISCMGGDGPVSLCDPAQEQAYLDYLKQSLEAAQKVGCERLAIHSNELLPEPQQYAADLFEQYSDAEKTMAMYRTLCHAAPLAEKAGVTLCIEPLNVEIDHLGNFLKYTKDAADLVRMVDSPNIKILYDAYHMYLNEGKICETIKKYQSLIGQIHIADAPGRGEPGTGCINYRAVLEFMKNLQCDQMVAFELYPKTGSEAAVRAINAVRAGL